jgi:hypothetical protein
MMTARGTGDRVQKSMALRTRPTGIPAAVSRRGGGKMPSEAPHRPSSAGIRLLHKRSWLQTESLPNKGLCGSESACTAGSQWPPMASCWRTSRRGLVWAKESTLHPSAQEIVRAAPAATTRSRRGFNQRKQKSQGQVPTPALLAWFARLIKFCATSSLRDASSGELIVRQARPCLTAVISMSRTVATCSAMARQWRFLMEFREIKKNCGAPVFNLSRRERNR